MAGRRGSGDRPGLFLIRGEAGIGKTRLAEKELIDWVPPSQRDSAPPPRAVMPAKAGLAYTPIASVAQERHAAGGIDGARSASWLTDIARLRPEMLASRPDVSAPGPPGRDLATAAAASKRSRPGVPRLPRRSSSSPTTCNGPTATPSSGFSISCARHPTRAVSSSGPCARKRSRTIRPLVQMLRSSRTGRSRWRLIALRAARSSGRPRRNWQAPSPSRRWTKRHCARTFRWKNQGHPLFIVERGRMDLVNQPRRPDPERLPRVQSCGGASGAAVGRRAGGRRGRGGRRPRLPVRHSRRRERPRGGRARPRARRVVAPPCRPRAARGAMGLRSRPDPGAGLRAASGPARKPSASIGASRRVWS